MDVRCERCRAQYLFDEAQVTEAGLAVQCTNCGHVFKVKKKALVVTLPVKPDELADAHPVSAAEATRAVQAKLQPAPAAAPPAPEKPREWRVRQANGNVFTFKELTTLQKWIVERKVSRDDEISLSGDQWKRLGNIAELASFFQVVEAAERGQAQGGQPAVTPLPMVLMPPGGGYPGTVYPAPGYATGGYPLPPPYPPPPPAQPGAPVTGQAPITQVNITATPSAGWNLQGAGGMRTRPPEVAPWRLESTSATDLESEDLAAVRPGGAGKWLAAAVLLLLVAAGAVYALRPQWLGLSRGKPAETVQVPLEMAPNPAPAAPPAPPPPVAAPAAAAPQPPAPEPKAEPAPPPTPEKAPQLAVEKEPPQAKAPRGAKALLAQAKKLRDREKTTQALDLYGKVVELEPENAEALSGRGWCYLELSEYAPAEASFQEALQHDPESADGMMGLAETYRYQGRKADARKMYEKYLAVHPEGDDVEVARNQIAQLKE